MTTRAPRCPLFAPGSHWPVLGGVPITPTLGPPAMGRPGRVFGAVRRRTVLGVRLPVWDHYHCGVDLDADGGQAVVAIESGVVVSWHRYYRSVVTGLMTWALLVRHAHCHVLYGELQRPGPQDWRKAGLLVDAGQIVGAVSSEMGTPMLHLETYGIDVVGLDKQAGRRRLAWRGKGAAPPAGLLDPTAALVELARR